jgi:transcriptional regulator with GAF, ATPase, and Fis domain/pSer/pThr/pTyr-binding forkhead associated (FHA) protein
MNAPSTPKMHHAADFAQSIGMSHNWVQQGRLRTLLPAEYVYLKVNLAAKGVPKGEKDKIRMSPKLTVIAGPGHGTTYQISGDRFSIGRDSQNHFSIPDTSVSREHCVIVREADGFFIRDLQSHNGTQVNDVPIKDQLLAHRDCISIGHTVLQFLLRDDVVFEETAETGTISILADKNSFLGASAAAADLQALLRVSTMLHSFHAIYRGRGSSARTMLEQHLLALIIEVIPASRGAILLYEDGFDEPSSLSIKDQDSRPQRPVTVSRHLVKRVLTEACGLLVEDSADRSLVLAPLVIRQEACGVIYLEGAAFRETHLQLLVAISQLASMAMENAFQLEWLETENERLEAELHPDHHMIGDSAPLRDLQRSIARAAQSNSTVLILGETGTGKELTARAIHQNGSRAAKPFVGINCAALSETLLESELFGHEKGAFTGAVVQKKGRLEFANGGTVFLDEIGEMPLQLQVKLLRVLQERQVERVGGTQPVKLDIRLIAATNRNLEEEVRAGRFRQDLYYRLNVVTLKTPALRDRPSDILPLAMHFAAKFGQQCGRRITGISPQVQPYLLRYEWPGNIRELENAIERALVLGSADMIELEDLPETIREGASAAGEGRSLPLEAAIDDAKRQAITRAFAEAQGDHPEAAKLLGVNPNYLYRLMRNLGLR